MASAPSSASSAAAKYVMVSNSEFACYMVRDDGAIDVTTRKGKVSLQIAPPTGLSYTAVSAGHDRSHILRSDGVVYRGRGFYKGKPLELKHEVRPPPGLTYTAVSSGPSYSYLLRSDGKVERYANGMTAERELVPADGSVIYTAISSGQGSTYFLRSDGKIDRVRSGEVKATLAPDAPGVTYVAMSDQKQQSTDSGPVGNSANYLVRSDGLVDRMIRLGTFDCTMKAESAGVSANVKYVGATAGTNVSYLIRDDGSVDRVRGGKVKCTMHPPEGVAYTAATAGPGASFLLRSDGMVDRTVRDGKIACTIVPPHPSEIEPDSRCAIV